MSIINSLDDFKKNGLGRVLTGHSDGPILYNSRDNTLTYWSKKTNSFSGKRIQSPFNSKMVQGFYHPKLAEIKSDLIPFPKESDLRQTESEMATEKEGNQPNVSMNVFFNICLKCMYRLWRLSRKC